jgi:hypothetical protein
LGASDQRIVHAALSASIGVDAGGTTSQSPRGLIAASSGGAPSRGGGRGVSTRSRGAGRARGRGRGRGGRGRGRVLTPATSPSLQRYLTWRGQNPSVDPRSDETAQRYYAAYQADLASARKVVDDARTGVAEATRALSEASIDEGKDESSDSSSRKRRRGAPLPPSSHSEATAARSGPSSSSSSPAIAGTTSATQSGGQQTAPQPTQDVEMSSAPLTMAPSQTGPNTKPPEGGGGGGSGGSS